MKIFELGKQPVNQIITDIKSDLDQGEIIIAPTETAYGMMARADDRASVLNLFHVKNRDIDKPSAICIRGTSQIIKYAYVNRPQLLNRIEQLWPGPVTVILNARESDWPGIVSGDGRIGFRCSSHEFMIELMDEIDYPLTATSANLSGRDVQSIAELKNAFGDKIKHCIIDPDLKFDRPLSTVVDLSGPEINILRKGAIDEETIRKVFSDDR